MQVSQSLLLLVLKLQSSTSPPKVKLALLPDLSSRITEPMVSVYVPVGPPLVQATPKLANHKHVEPIIFFTQASVMFEISRLGYGTGGKPVPLQSRCA